MLALAVPSSACHRCSMRRLVAVLLGLALGVISGASANDAATPRVLASGDIRQAAQDGSVVAWDGFGSNCREAIVLERGSGTRSRLKTECGTFGTAIAVAGKRAVYDDWEDCCNHGYGGVVTEVPGSKPAGLQGLGLEYWSYGQVMSAAAGDGTTLVYSVVEWDVFGAFEDCYQTGCRYRVGPGGGVWRVVGSKRVRVPGTPPAFLIAVDEGRVLVVPADRAVCVQCEVFGDLKAAPGGQVTIIDAVTGKRLTQFAPQGRVMSAALSSSSAAVLVAAGKQRRIETYNSTDGSLVATTTVPLSALQVAAWENRAAYTTRYGVYLLESGTKRLLAKTSGPPHSLSFDTDRVIWVEDGKKVDRLLEMAASR